MDIKLVDPVDPLFCPISVFHIYVKPFQQLVCDKLSFF